MTTIIIILVAIFALPFIIALFVKKDYAVERSIIINNPKHEVFDYIKYIKNQDKYSKWSMMDPEMKTEFKGTDGTEGFIYAWEGKKAGIGEQEIKSIAEGERITMELRFVKPFVSTGHTYMTTEALTEHSTKMTWGLYGSNPYPRNIMNLIIGGMLGKDIDTSLNNLKKLLENNK